MKTALAATAALMIGASVAGAALAQTSSTSPIPSLVNVDLRNVLNDLAVKLNIDRANVPVTAQVPVTVAANVCGVSVNVLSVSTGGQANCTAKTGSVQLAQAVQQQMAAGGSATGSLSGGASGVGGTAVGSLGGSTGQTAAGGTTSTGMNSSTSTGQATNNTPTAQPTAAGSAQAGASTTPRQASNPTNTGGAQARSAGANGQPAATTSTAPGRSASAPGHVKKKHNARSARAYAPGHQQ